MIGLVITFFLALLAVTNGVSLDKSSLDLSYKEVQIGTSITVFGTLTGDSFEVSLPYGRQPHNTGYALHIAYDGHSRISGKLTIDAKLDGDWVHDYEPVRVEHLEKHRLFNIRIDILANHFEVYLNESHVADISHRVPPIRIYRVSVGGDFLLSCFTTSIKRCVLPAVDPLWWFPVPDFLPLFQDFEKRKSGSKVLG